MDRQDNSNRTLQAYFFEAVHRSFASRLGVRGYDDVVSYLAAMLAVFARGDAIYAIRDADGRPVRTVAEMLAEGDVRLNADSFDREREVHQHVGDYLLFWSGFFPEALVEHVGAGGLNDAIRQGKLSYSIVSSFDYGRYSDEAPTFRKLSDRFEVWRDGLEIVRSSFDGLRPPDPRVN